ncbi:MAG: acyl-CoA thioesterase [Saprospiraceae bacterium]|nr:acyl-CoA thioesterase [Saprospiraceae bacterium]MBK6665995.1 acyl-CoA thioesterase [Saprospiraceae bacterium]MBK9581376.1 acyl-CoA thioesterase [Saprospiraceae bacterium]MBP8212630.1 acyl-CoA thioesterase [Saprospiraceae bacterium]HQV67724.1 thioesterase family protein [Saprospiraceae bacterium]
MYSFDFKKRVRYGETDMMGYLYYGNYAQLYEIGRVETMRSLGLNYRDLEVVYGVMMPVVHVDARYILPAKYDEELTIRTILTELPSRMIVFENEIFNEEMQMIHKAVVKLFFIEMSSGKKVSCPEYMLEKLRPLF